MTIRMFDYIYFNDLLSNQDTDELDEKYFACQTAEMDLIFDHYFSKTDEFYANTPRAFKERCLCGSLHNGWLKLEQLQLVALACYHLACKFWERFPPRVSYILLIFGDTGRLVQHCFASFLALQPDAINQEPRGS